VALPCACLTGLLTTLHRRWNVETGVVSDGSVVNDNAAWSGFSFLVGFLIVFRTSQAYNRFWDGCTATHRMRAEWFDGCSAVVAFCKHSQAASEVVHDFQCQLVRLFSMLHAVALAEIEDSNGKCKHIESVHAFRYPLIDVGGVDSESLAVTKESEAKVELIFQWIQQHIVENISTGVLNIPPPILSRAFQEVANGMVAFHDAMKISYVPFPFPYAQVCDTLLMLHWVLVPFVVSQWVNKAWWAATFAFVQVFILWSLSFIALELENPFGMDANDIDAKHMQTELNLQLMLLLRDTTQRTPKSNRGYISREVFEEKTSSVNSRRKAVCFHDVWLTGEATQARVSRDSAYGASETSKLGVRKSFRSEMRHSNKSEARKSVKTAATISFSDGSPLDNESPQPCHSLDGAELGGLRPAENLSGFPRESLRFSDRCGNDVQHGTADGPSSSRPRREGVPNGSSWQPLVLGIEALPAQLSSKPTLGGTPDRPSASQLAGAEVESRVEAQTSAPLVEASSGRHSIEPEGTRSVWSPVVPGLADGTLMFDSPCQRQISNPRGAASIS